MNIKHHIALMEYNIGFPVPTLAKYLLYLSAICTMYHFVLQLDAWMGHFGTGDL